MNKQIMAFMLAMTFASAQIMAGIETIDLSAEVASINKQEEKQSFVTKIKRAIATTSDLAKGVACVIGFAALCLLKFGPSGKHEANKPDAKPSEPNGPNAVPPQPSVQVPPVAVPPAARQPQRQADNGVIPPPLPVEEARRAPEVQAAVVPPAEVAAQPEIFVDPAVGIPFEPAVQPENYYDPAQAVPANAPEPQPQPAVQPQLNAQNNDGVVPPPPPALEQHAYDRVVSGIKDIHSRFQHARNAFSEWWKIPQVTPEVAAFRQRHEARMKAKAAAQNKS